MSHRPIQTDIFPEYMTFSVTQSAANTNTSSRIQMPIARLPDRARVQVMEIVKISVEYSDIGDASGDLYGSSLAFRNFNTTEATLGEPSVFFKDKHVFNLVTSGGRTDSFIHMYDFTTGGGRGLLIATDSIFAQATSVSLAAAMTAKFKVWYRFVMVGLQEYVGIVQQQGAQN